MGSWTRTFIMMLAALLAALLAAALAAETVAAQEEDLAKRFLRAAEGLQMPGSEADSFWWFVSYPGEEELPTAERMASLHGLSSRLHRPPRRCDEATGLRRHVRLARKGAALDGPRAEEERPRFRQTAHNLFHHQFGDDLAVYRCDTNKYGEVRIYFLGLIDEGLSGLKTINIET
jgi:hypothetical protein